MSAARKPTGLLGLVLVLIMTAVVMRAIRSHEVATAHQQIQTRYDLAEAAGLLGDVEGALGWKAYNYEYISPKGKHHTKAEVTRWTASLFASAAKSHHSYEILDFQLEGERAILIVHSQASFALKPSTHYHSFFYSSKSRDVWQYSPALGWMETRRELLEGTVLLDGSPRDYDP